MVPRWFLIALAVSALAVGFAAVWFAVAWRQHNPPCPKKYASPRDTPQACIYAP